MKGGRLMNDMVYKIKADFLKALSHPVRLKIIEALKHGERSVGSLVKELGVEQSSLSRHLLALRDAGILQSRQERTTVYYSIRDHDVFQVLRPIAVLLRKKFKESERVLVTLGKK
ncbi:MAG: transcriptional regulator [Candidatus Omnitrophica bacterium CG11_big_fil_rev_8_21_14_0_20_64_10]|nr:MAG: transcriptional regulator [Candidatus Omnitrophica bacterium CG11_big_fil_rev_8_21_14_0_20_64_10]